MSNTIRLVAVAMLAILVGCGQGKDASADKASEAAGKAMDSAADAADVRQRRCKRFGRRDGFRCR